MYCHVSADCGDQVWTLAGLPDPVRDACMALADAKTRSDNSMSQSACHVSYLLRNARHDACKQADSLSYNL